jgi:hypothetical protein
VSIILTNMSGSSDESGSRRCVGMDGQGKRFRAAHSGVMARLQHLNSPRVVINGFKCTADECPKGRFYGHVIHGWPDARGSPVYLSCINNTSTPGV